MTVFIVDTYNKYERNDNVRSTFHINGFPYCIREVELEWGKVLLERLEDTENVNFRLYDTYAEALEYVQQLRAANH